MSQQDETIFKLGLDATSLQRGLTSVGSQIKTFTTEAVADFTKAFAVAGLVAKITGLARDMVQLRRNAEEQGVGTSFLQSLGKLTEKFGGSVEDADMALTKLNIKLGEAADPASAAAKAFQKYGIALVDSSGMVRTAEDVMRSLMDHYHNLPDAASRATLANDFFAKSGSHLAQVLALGSDEFDRFTKRLEDTGKILKPEEVKTYADAWLAVKSAMSTIGEPIATLTEKVLRGWTLISRTLDNVRGLDGKPSMGLGKALDAAVASTQPAATVRVMADTREAETALERLADDMAEAFAKVQASIATAMRSYRDAVNASTIAGMTVAEAQQRQRVNTTPEGSRQRIQEQARLDAMINAREERELSFLDKSKAAATAEMEALGRKFHLAIEGEERERVKLEMAQKGIEIAKIGEEIQRRTAQHIDAQGNRAKAINDEVERRNAMLADAKDKAATAGMDLAEARAERTKYTLQELATGNPNGVRDSDLRQQMLKAQEIVRMERAARSGRFSEDESQGILDRALEMRRSLTRLSATDRAPLKPLEEKADLSNRHLKVIADGIEKVNKLK